MVVLKMVVQNGNGNKRENIFNELKDLILTLKNNIGQPSIKGKWLQKSEQIQNAIKELSSEDQIWLSTEYDTWYKEVLHPHLTDDQRKMYKKENF